MLDEQAVTSNLPYTKRQNNVAYIGGITRNRGALENIKAFDHIKHSDARLLLAGTFMDDGLESQCRALDSWEYVDYQGFISREDVWALLENTRVGLVVLHPLDNYIDALPIKLFEYMAAGVPVIASDFPLWRRIVSQADCGLLVNPLVPEEIGEAIDWLLDNPESAERMGQNGKNAVRMKYNWSQEEQKLLSLYETFSAHSV
jgi:glycosyltransferase involved in cell wall biosynthesis